MDKSSHIFRGSDGEEDNEDLLTLSLSTGPKSSSAAPAPSSSPLGIQTLQPTCLPLTSAASLSPQTSFLQQFRTIPQAPPLPSTYPNHQSHSPTGLNPNDNGAPQEIVSH
ncbi:hypothetical protein CRYUN_Cryun05aG0248600 [Craigia yunnanensis]